MLLSYSSIQQISAPLQQSSSPIKHYPCYCVHSWVWHIKLSATCGFSVLLFAVAKLLKSIVLFWYISIYANSCMCTCVLHNMYMYMYVLSLCKRTFLYTHGLTMVCHSNPKVTHPSVVLCWIASLIVVLVSPYIFWPLISLSCFTNCGFGCLPTSFWPLIRFKSCGINLVKVAVFVEGSNWPL